MFEFCFRTKATIVPNGPDWLHEVKYGGYRLRLERDRDRVRLIVRGGYNWTDHLSVDRRGGARGSAEKRFVRRGCRAGCGRHLGFQRAARPAP
jgi:hypothetical protein